MDCHVFTIVVLVSAEQNSMLFVIKVIGSMMTLSRVDTALRKYFHCRSLGLATQPTVLVPSLYTHTYLLTNSLKQLHRATTL